MNNFFKRILGGTEGSAVHADRAAQPTSSQTPPMPKVRRPRKPKVAAVAIALSEKDEATQKGEPWVGVLGIELDPNNLGNGSFNLDFNEIFVARLVKAGYKGKTDFDIVDQWFNAICRNVITETFEQEMADPDKRNDWNATGSK